MSSIELTDFSNYKHINKDEVIYIQSQKSGYLDSCLYYIDKGIITPIYTINGYYNSLSESQQNKLKRYIFDNTVDTLFHCAKIYSTYQFIRIFV